MPGAHLNSSNLSIGEVPLHGEQENTPLVSGDGLNSESAPSYAAPPSVLARLRVWHLQKQRLEILLAALLLPGQAPKQAQCQPRKTVATSPGLWQDMGSSCPFCPNQGLGHHHLRI